jgi:ubiquinone/menaquinone biosynthesis C-methylase UbiE
MAILEIGCGDCPLISDLSDRENLVEMIGIDFSQTVVDGLLAKYKNKPKAPHYLYMDARKLDFQNEKFQFIIDKGTIDAMLCDQVNGFENARMIIEEAIRVLKKSGSMMIISNMEVDSIELHETISQSIGPALRTKRHLNWKIDAHVVSCQEGTPNATVYVISSSPKPNTRSVTRMLSCSSVQNVDDKDDFNLPFKVFEY